MHSAIFKMQGENPMNSNPQYNSYMLRLQWVKNNKEPMWIVSMQSTSTGELRWFPSLDAMITFLREEFDVGEEIGDKLLEQRPYDNERLSPEKHPAEPVPGRGLGCENIP
jgi:hypothetical protein